MAKWTEEQLAAIEARDKNVIVSAAAGSGKTAVLVERIIGIITDESLGADVDSLLVVTFTNAAAAEMKERISAAVSKKIELNPQSEHLHRQLALLGRANIMTIHAFCTKLIRNFYVKLDIDPSARIADESECALLKSDALDGVLEEMFEKEDNEDFVAFAESVKDETGFNNLKKTILNTYENIQSLPFPLYWLKNSVNKFVLDENGLEGSLYGKMFIENCYKEIWALILRLTAVKDFVPFEYLDNFTNDIYEFTRMKNALEEDDYDKAYDIVNSFEFSRLPRKKKETDEAEAKNAQAVRNEVKDIFKKMKENYFFRTFEEMEEDMRFCIPALKGLYECVEKFTEIYTEMKKEKNAIDFNDLEHMAVKILYNFDENSGLFAVSEEAETLQRDFYEIMTDEYQDSNIVQEMILNALSGRGKNMPNRFMVGDVKQSIYRFRQADPSVFMGKIKSLADDENSKVIYLSKNFRSRKNVLDSINFIFRQIMSEETGLIDYNENEALYYGADFSQSNDRNTSYETELDIIELKEGTEETDEDEEDMTSAQKELIFIAERIQKLIGDGFKVLDKESGEYRNIRYGDIVVLLRSTRSWAAAAEEIFRNYSIPVFAGGDSGYFNKKEVALIVSFLKVIDNSYQDIPVMVVLKSYVYNVSDDELAQIRCFADNENFIENVREYIQNGDNENIKEKLKRFADDIDKWKKTAPFITVRELLWQIYTQTGYYDYAGALPMGKIKQANLTMLLERAESAAQTGIKSLFDFINYIEKIEKNAVETGEAKVLNENENVVRIMTIHKSKGLEFPVVFVSGLGKGFNISDISESYIFHSKIGVGCDYLNSQTRVCRKTAAKTVIAEKIRQELIEEEMRVLYVALTRAKEKLILTCGVKDIEKTRMKWCSNSSATGHMKEYYVRSAHRYIDWIGAAVASHKDADSLRAGIYIGKSDDCSNWSINIIDGSEKENSEEDVPEGNMPVEGNMPLIEEKPSFDVFSALSYEYPYKKFADISASISISEIKRNYQKELLEEPEIKQEYKRPDFTKEVSKLTSAQKGTAIHTVMEHLDFRKKYTKEELKEFTKYLREISVITEEEEKSVNLRKIENFILSPIGERIRNADTVKKETPFAMEISAYEAYGDENYRQCDEKVVVHGIVDCYFSEGNKTVLLDYKTDYVPKGEENGFFDKYKIQLDIYSLAIERSTGRKVDEKYIYSFYLDKFIKM